EAGQPAEVELFGDLGGGQPGGGLAVPLGGQGGQQGVGALPGRRGQGGKVGVLQKGVQRGAHLGGRKAVFGQEGGAFQGGLPRLVDDAGDADLGRHFGQAGRRIPPGKVLAQGLDQGGVGR